MNRRGFDNPPPRDPFGDHQPRRILGGVTRNPTGYRERGILGESIARAKQLDGQTTITVKVDADSKGYFDRECPSEHCEYIFKVNLSDWKNQIADGDVFCPLCRKQAPAKSWWTKEQLPAATEQAKQFVLNELMSAFERDAKDFNRRQSRNSFLQISMKVNRGQSPDAPPIPSSDPYRLEISCEHCSFRFAVLGSAYFCPKCGSTSVDRQFNQGLEKIRIKADNAAIIRNEWCAKGMKDEGEHLGRSLIESGINDSITAFQCLCDSLWEKHSPSDPDPKNDFQSLDRGSRRWEGKCGTGYKHWLSSTEFGRLNVFFQRRHILVHCDGIVDQGYLDKSNDLSYVLGQRIVVSADDLRDLTSLIKKIADQLRENLAALP